MDDSPPHTVSILGSCVTRDVFNFKPSTTWKVKNYVARTSFVSLTSPALKPGSPIQAPSAFECRNIVSDFEKLAWESLSTDCDYLILDLIDERFNLVRVGNSYVLATPFMLASGALAPYDRHTFVERTHPEMQELWLAACKKVCRILVERFGISKLILHKSYHATHCLHGSEVLPFSGYHAKLAAEHNKILKSYYDRIQTEIDGIRVVQVPQEEILADADHAWGQQPFHFTKDYYERIFSSIKSIADRRFSSSI